MKKINKLLTLCLSLMFAFGVGAFAAACSDNEDSSPAESSSSSASSETSDALNCYKFIVLNQDGTPAQNVSVQLCMYNEDGTLGACLAPAPVDNAGKVDYTYVTSKGIYQIHILDSENNPVEFEGATDTPNNYAELTLTLKN